MVILQPPIAWVGFSNVRLGRGERSVSRGVLFRGRLCIGNCSAAVENGLARRRVSSYGGMPLSRRTAPGPAL